MIGFVGNTGRSVAPHLHYEIRKDGKHLNPINFYYGDLNTEEFNASLGAYIGVPVGAEKSIPLCIRLDLVNGSVRQP